MKKLNKNQFIIPFFLFFIPLLYLFPLFHSGLYISHDGENHVARLAAYSQSIKDGQFPVRWAGDLNFAYGSPVFIFFYPAPYYIGTIFHIIGFSFENSFKIIVGLSFLSAFFTFYLWISTLFRKEVAVIGALLYGFAPYHFLDLYVRGDVGELMAFVFIPLVFLSIDKLIKKSSLNIILLGGVFFALLILSHNGESLMFTPVFFMYLLVRKKKIKDFFRGLIIFFLGFLLSAFFWIPSLLEGKYINTSIYIGQMFRENFPRLSQLVYSSWGFGSDVTQKNGLSPQIGIILQIFVVLSIVIFVFRKKERKITAYWLIVFFLSVFISLPISNFLWTHLPLLHLFEFPWRFTALSSFSAAVLGCYVFSVWQNRLFFLIVAFAIFIISIPFTKTYGYVLRGDTYYKMFSGTTFYHGEATPKWTAGNASQFYQFPVEVISGKGEISHYTRKSNEHSFIVSSLSSVGIVDNTVYFPGWKVLIDGKKVPIEFQNILYRGLITFKVPKGVHTIVIVFQESPVRLISDLISFGSIVFLILLFIIKKYYKRPL